MFKFPTLAITGTRLPCLLTSTRQTPLSDVTSKLRDDNGRDLPIPDSRISHFPSDVVGSEGGSTSLDRGSSYPVPGNRHADE